MSSRPETWDRRRRTLRGQIWSIDFTSGAVILTLILLLFILMWNNIAVRWNAANEYRQMQTGALFASEALMATSGDPESWEMLPSISNISSFGLVNGRNELNDLKLGRLAAENASVYYTVKERLGLQRYELGIRVTDLGKNETYHEFGRFAETLNDSVVYERMGLLNGSEAIVRIEVWR